MLDNLAETSVLGVAIGWSRCPRPTQTLIQNHFPFRTAPHEVDLGVYSTRHPHMKQHGTLGQKLEKTVSTLSRCLKTAGMNRRGFLPGDPGSEIFLVEEVKP